MGLIDGSSKSNSMNSDCVNKCGTRFSMQLLDLINDGTGH